MTFISVTRLRLRSARFLPLFVLDMLRTRRQISAASGFRGGSLLNDRDRTFWSLTAWDSRASMRSYMTGGAHRKAMPHLLSWCDEASVVNWEQADDTLPAWKEAERRMRADGRASKVDQPSPNHAGLSFREPRTRTAAPIAPTG